MSQTTSTILSPDSMSLSSLSLTLLTRYSKSRVYIMRFLKFLLVKVLSYKWTCVGVKHELPQFKLCIYKPQFLVRDLQCNASPIQSLTLA